MFSKSSTNRMLSFSTKANHAQIFFEHFEEEEKLIVVVVQSDLHKKSCIGKKN